MEFSLEERKLPVYKLILHKDILSHFLSFSESIVKCNFTTVNGWKGKTYIDKHEVDEYCPDRLRGVEVVDLYYTKTVDYVILTDEQFKDFNLIAGNHFVTRA
jgi:hypothetical protein